MKMKRVSKLNMIYIVEMHDELKEAVTPHELTITGSSTYLLIHSEVRRLLYGSEGSNHLKNHSSLHPGILNITKTIAAQGLDVVNDLFTTMGFLEADSKPLRNLRMDLEEKLRNMEKAFLFASLVQCKKIALVFQQNVAEVFAQQLRAMGKKYVFVGKEGLINTTLEFHIQRFAPSFVRRRIAGIEVSGIWIYWDKLIQTSYNINAWKMSPLYLSRPNMNGHILIVFLVLMFGILVASIFFVFEAVIAFGRNRFHKLPRTFSLKSV